MRPTCIAAQRRERGMFYLFDGEELIEYRACQPHIVAAMLGVKEGEYSNCLL
ncbi:MAG: hypothetical protein NWE88_11865 [Candidatus Bathyarchaeota archaeon]|nr:hypothetical protein [Candidatus Bathyarchaeota archaeon]